jgi:hypothetical protein
MMCCYDREKREKRPTHIIPTQHREGDVNQASRTPSCYQLLIHKDGEHRGIDRRGGIENDVNPVSR